MPSHKVYLGNIKGSLPLKEIEADMLLNKQATPLKVNFDNDQFALLDISNPRATIWAKMIYRLQQKNHPVYVEADAATNIITRFCIPIAAKVLEIVITDEDVIEVILNSSDALHLLRRDHPDFEVLYSALQLAKDTDATIMITATMHHFEIIDVRAQPASFLLKGPDDPLPPPMPIVPVSPEKCAELFKMVNAKACTIDWLASPCITYKFPSSGCNVRAHLMCRLIIDAGAIPEKVWIFYGLKARSSNVPGCKIGWGWHVAPSLMVTQPVGEPIRMILDPSLCDEPVTEAYWKSLQGNTKATLAPIQWEGYYYLGKGTATPEEAEAEMQDYRLRLADMWHDEGYPPYECS